MKKRESAIRRENEKQLLIDPVSGEPNITIDEMIKIHNDKVKKRKYSQYEKENVSIDRNVGYSNRNIENNQYTVDNKNLLLRTKKKVATSKKNTVYNKMENLNNKHNSTANLRNFNKSSEFNSIKINSSTSNISHNNLLVSSKKPNTSINKTNSNEEKLILKTAKKKDSNSRDIVKEKTIKKVPLRVNRFELNQNNQFAFNSYNNLNTKIFKRGHSTNEASKDYKSIIPKNIQANASTDPINRNRNSTNSSVTYCPRMFSASIMKKVFL